MPRPVSFYLDTNALRYLFRSPTLDPAEQEEVVNLVIELNGRQLIATSSSNAAFNELSGVARKDWNRYLSILALINRVIGPRIVMDTPRLMDKELRQRRPLRAAEMYLSAADRRKLRMHMRTPEFLEWVENRSAEEARDFASNSGDFKEKVALAALRTRRPVQADWREQRVVNALVTSHIYATLGPVAGELRSRRRLLETAPSVWNFYAYRMTRMYLNVFHNRRIRPSDVIDAHHFVAGSYSDVIVTDDADFKATCSHIGYVGPKLMQFSDFVEEVRMMRRRR